MYCNYCNFQLNSAQRRSMWEAGAKICSVPANHHLQLSGSSHATLEKFQNHQVAPSLHK